MEVPKTVAVLLLVASALAGCSAISVDHFSINYVNCNLYGVVSVTSDTIIKATGTVCGDVDSVTANYICSNFNYGIALGHGTASNKGVSGGSGAIEAMNLRCTSSGGCTYDLPDASCKHSQDLVLFCSNQPTCLSAGIIAAIVVAVVFFFLILPLICACICCCVCAYMGAACFASSTPDYGRL